MPIYEYKCNECGSKYEILHLSHEVVDDIFCPDCRSTHYSRLMSTINVGRSGAGKKSESDMPPCSSECCGGSCGIA